MDYEDAIVRVCNDALLELGQKVPVHKLVAGEGERLSPNEAICASKFAGARQAVLCAHPWSFATRRTEVEPTGPEEGESLPYSFALPEGALAITDIDGQAEFYVQDGKVRTSRYVRWCEYTSDVEDVGLWSAQMRVALVRRLAADIAIAVTGNLELLKACEERYEMALGAARAGDVQRGKARRRVLSEAPWGFAVRQASVTCESVEDGETDGVYKFRFPLPDRAMYVADVQRHGAFYVSDGQVYVKRPVKWCDFVVDVEDVSAWTPNVRAAYDARLSADAAFLRGVDAQTLQLAEERYRIAVEDAKKTDMHKGSLNEYEGSNPTAGKMPFEDALIGLCNKALSELGVQTPIERLTPEDGRTLSVAEATCSAHIAGARQAVLCAHPWSFATREIGIACTPAVGQYRSGAFRFRFRKPSAALKVTDVERHVAFFVRGNWVYLKEPVRSATYTEDVENPDEWDAIARMAWVRRLAADIATGVGASAMLEAAEARFRVALGDAKLADAREGRSEDALPCDPITFSMMRSVPRFEPEESYARLW